MFTQHRRFPKYKNRFERHFRVKSIMLGDSSVGKTSFFTRVCTGMWQDKPVSKKIDHKLYRFFFFF